MIRGKIIQLVPAPDQLFEPNPTGYGGSLQPSNLLCLGLTNEGEIVIITHSPQTARYWQDMNIRAVMPDIIFERNDH